MNRRTWLKSMVLSLIFPPSLTAQTSRAYAKFGSSGETVGLYNLTQNVDPAGTWVVIEGTVASVSTDKREKEMDYLFGLNTRVGLRSFRFTLGRDDISETDVRDLLTRKRGVRVRACRVGRYWFAEVITRF